MIVFPSNNKFGIPTLRKDLEAVTVSGSCRSWGSVSRHDRHRGSWHFYVDDYKFSGLWAKPYRLVKTNAKVVTETNPSVNGSMPFAVVLYETFRKRWLARYWQDSGVRIYVDLFVPECLADINLTGVPAGWRAYSTRAHDGRLDDLAFRTDKARAHAGADEINLLVVGGGRRVASFCSTNNFTHVRTGALGGDS